MKIHLELLGQVPLYLGMGIEILLAVFLGGLVGFDRERKMKSAGIKTNMLICLGATLYTAISLLNHATSGVNSDPNRISAQIVSGIGFLGAGAIIQGKGGVTGLTTAASMWVVAAIGITIGSGYPVIATLFTLTLLIVLRLLDPLYRFLSLHNNFYIEVTGFHAGLERLNKLLENEAEEIIHEGSDVVDLEAGIHIHRYLVNMNPKKLKHVLSSLQSSPQIKKIHYHYINRDDEIEALKSLGDED